MSLSRRELLKAQAAAVAAAAAGIAVPAVAQPVAGGVGSLEIKWSKAPCRFCGTGCGVMVGVKAGKVVATHGDTLAEVNRGLNCIKGYFLSKIMYGGDRLTTPLLRKKGGVFAKDGELTPVTWDEAFDVMAARAKATLKEKGPTALGMFGSGQWTVYEGYAATKLMRAGFRSNNLDPNARHCMASAAVAFMRTFGMDEPMGCYDDFEAADAFVLWGSNMAEMHPILWTRLTDRRLSHPHVKVAVLSTFTHRSSDLADIPIVFKPGTDLAILNYIANHIITTGRVNQDFVKNHTTFVKGTVDIGYGLRPDHPLEVKAKGAATRRRDPADRLRRLCRLCEGLHAREGLRAHRRRTRLPAGARRALCRSEAQGDVALDHGLQPACARRMGQPAPLQSASADRKDLRARQFAVLADRPAIRLRHRARGRHLRASSARRHGRHQSGAPQAHRGNLARPARHHSGKAGLSRGRTGPDAERRQAEFLLDPGEQQPAGRAELVRARPIRATGIRPTSSSSRTPIRP